MVFPRRESETSLGTSILMGWLAARYPEDAFVHRETGGSKFVELTAEQPVVKARRRNCASPSGARVFSPRYCSAPLGILLAVQPITLHQFIQRGYMLSENIDLVPQATSLFIISLTAVYCHSRLVSATLWL
ncbi:hypothetical protein TcWFU_003691 [Taenia crassiceps]|uniref:Uncharacterized protein n=1 Tax=Taenia crassiceps TaxID=6207 RepID=A0ABR4QB82_9CEST